jgi:hypothetical protein
MMMTHLRRRFFMNWFVFLDFWPESVSLTARFPENLLRIQQQPTGIGMERLAPST